MRHPWFVRRGWSYRPVAWQGVLITLAVLAGVAVAFLRVDGRSHSVSDTLYGVVPWWVLCLLLGHALAWLTSDRGTSHPRP